MTDAPPQATPAAEVLGVVAIGRNEGDRLRRCLDSLEPHGVETVYVDSGSSDGSVELARERGAHAIELDADRPFTAARGRLEGAEALLSRRPNLEFLLFVDGDCEVDDAWPDAAIAFLRSNPRAGAVCGRRREQFPDASLYNRFVDVEWETPVGECVHTGGDSVVRVAAYREAGGWDPRPIAGEEPEFCKRLRGAGWAVWRIDHEMTRHDIAMTRFGQWWKRQVRTGHGGAFTERNFQVGVFGGIVRSAWIWSAMIPATIAIVAVLAGWRFGPAAAGGALVGGVALYAVQALRIAWRARRDGRSWRASLEFGFLTMLSKPAILIGATKAWWEHRRRRESRLIEYGLPAEGAST